MEFHYKYTLTPDEFANFQAYTGWHAPWSKSLRTKFIIKTSFYAVLMMSATLIVLRKIKGHDKDIFLRLPILILIGAIIFVFFSYLTAPSRIRADAKKILGKEENNHLLNERSIILSDNGIETTGATFHSTLKWESITRYANTKDYFYLYLNSMQGYVIPKRIISPKSEIEQLDKFLTEKIPLESSFRSLGI